MPVGRPRVLDDAKQREICALLSAGCSIREAARYVGCAPNTIRREAKRNEEFNDKMRRAETFARLSPLHAMQRAAATHWRAAAWILERTHPDRFARRDPHAFRPKQAQALVNDVLRIIDTEILDPFKHERIQSRIRAVMKYAIHDVRDTCRSGSNLRRAMEYFDEIDRGNNPFEQLGLQNPYFESTLRRHESRDPDPSAEESLDRPATTQDLSNLVRALADRLRDANPATPSLPSHDHPVLPPPPPTPPPSAAEAQTP